MSRLASTIRRLAAQRDCLGRAADLIQDIQGSILELGLGNGRTYDHLRALLPGREIFVFDRQVTERQSCVPDGPHMILGDILETLPAAHKSIGGPVALVHINIGCGNPDESYELANELPRILAPLLASGAVVVSDQHLSFPGWVSLPPPAAVGPDRYFIWRVYDAVRQCQ